MTSERTKEILNLCFWMPVYFVKYSFLVIYYGLVYFLTEYRYDDFGKG